MLYLLTSVQIKIEQYHHITNEDTDFFCEIALHIMPHTA